MPAFLTLLKREWMQHRFGWTVLLLGPPAIALLVLAFGSAQFEFDGVPAGYQPPALLLASIANMASIGGLMGIALVAAYLTAPGLARRDYQDRSVEFWLSLPQGHAPSLGATLLAHLILLPMAAVVVGLLAGQVLSLLLVAKSHGIGAWAALPLGTLVVAMLALAARLALGVALAALWLAPLVLLAMAASAWLKRWGFPVVVIAVVGAGLWLDKLYGNPVVWETLGGVLERAGRAIAVADPSDKGFVVNQDSEPDILLSQVPAWAANDALLALSAVATLPFVAGLVVAAAGFALMVLRRSRGA